MAAPFVLVLPDVTIGGYYTLSATSVKSPNFWVISPGNCRDIRCRCLEPTMQCDQPAIQAHSIQNRQTRSTTG
jgi:hypothetical protein